jgi:putative addiction module component (TIGR02574 family)
MHRFEELKKLTREEKYQLIDFIWADLAEDTENSPLPDWQRKILEERDKTFEADKANAISIEELEHRIEERLKGRVS